MKKCVFAGTFDPPTCGHLRIIEKCLEIFDGVTVAVMVNPDKVPLISVGDRERLLKKLFSGDKRVKVRTFCGAAVDLLNEENTRFYVRGVRNTVDFEYENGDRFASEKLMPDLITIYIPADQDDLHISSSIVRNSVRFGKDYADYIPESILNELRQILEKKDV